MSGIQPTNNSEDPTESPLGPGNLVLGWMEDWEGRAGKGKGKETEKRKGNTSGEGEREGSERADEEEDDL